MSECKNASSLVGKGTRTSSGQKTKLRSSQNRCGGRPLIKAIKSCFIINGSLVSSCRHAAAWHQGGRETRGLTAWHTARPHSGSVHREEEEEEDGGMGAGYIPPPPPSPPSPFSLTPQSISNAFLRSGNKRGNSISSTVGPCEISFASPGKKALCLHHALFTVAFS